MKKFILITLLLAVAVAGQSSSGINLNFISYDPQPVQPGQVMDVYLEVVNRGEATERTSVELISEYPFEVLESQDYERAKNLGSVSTRQTLQFRVQVAEDAKDGVTPLRVRYWADSDEDNFVEQNFDINIDTFDSSLDIQKVEQYPAEIIPGEKGKIIIHLKNSDDRPLKNIDVVLDLTNSYDANTNMDNIIAVQAMVNARLEEVNRKVASGESPLRGITPMTKSGMDEGLIKTRFDAFAPVGTSNQKSIPLIRPSEVVKVEFNLLALPDIKPNIYAVPLYINYNDEDNNPFHVRVDTPIAVNMEPELFVDLESTTLRTTDFAGKVKFRVANRGLSELRYVTLDLLEDQTVQLITAPASIYLGNLMPGESKEGEFTILAYEKEIDLPLRVEFRDSFNKKHSFEKKIDYLIINKNYYRDLPYEMWLAWIILGVVILVLTIFYVRNLKKEK